MASAASQESLECPVCLVEVMKSPIYQCSNGHSFCSTCEPQLNKCPICRDPLRHGSIARNHALEQQSVQLLLRRKAQESGPGQTVVACPLQCYDCNWTGKAAEVPRHMFQRHESWLQYGSTARLSVPRVPLLRSCVLVSSKASVFRICLVWDQSADNLGAAVHSLEPPVSGAAAQQGFNFGVETSGRLLLVGEPIRSFLEETEEEALKKGSWLTVPWVDGNQDDDERDLSQMVNVVVVINH